MRCHLESVHSKFKEKNVEFFIRKHKELLKSQIFMAQTTKIVNEIATETSYLVSYQISQCGEVYSIAEHIIKPCAIQMVKCMLDQIFAKEIAIVPLPNDSLAQLD